MLRNRLGRDPLKVVRQLDAFPKVAEEYQTSTKIGGTRKHFVENSLSMLNKHYTPEFWINLFYFSHFSRRQTVSVLSRALIIYLIYTETVYYLDSKLLFKFKPDTDMDTKLKIHIDVTIATPCSSKFHVFNFPFFLIIHSLLSSLVDIGADILDSTNQNVFSFGVLEEQDTWWELCPEQKDYFEYVQHLNAYLREEYHSLSVWLSLKSNFASNDSHWIPLSARVLSLRIFCTEAVKTLHIIYRNAQESRINRMTHVVYMAHWLWIKWLAIFT